MKLNVTDNPLKPIDPDELEVLLKKLESEYLAKNKCDQLKYIEQHLYSETYSTDMPNLLEGITLHLMFVFFGSVSTNLYNEMSIGTRYFRHHCRANLLLHSFGRYLNTISPQPKAALQLAHMVRDYLDTNYIHTNTYKDFHDIFGYNEKYISLIFFLLDTNSLLCFINGSFPDRIYTFIHPGKLVCAVRLINSL